MKSRFIPTFVGIQKNMKDYTVYYCKMEICTKKYYPPAAKWIPAFAGMVIFIKSFA